jgi:hypothetical protein
LQAAGVYTASIQGYWYFFKDAGQSCVAALGSAWLAAFELALAQTGARQGVVEPDCQLSWSL